MGGGARERERERERERVYYQRNSIEREREFIINETQ
jgi:hypothetical protein